MPFRRVQQGLSICAVQSVLAIVYSEGSGTPSRSSICFNPSVKSVTSRQCRAQSPHAGSRSRNFDSGKWCIELPGLRITGRTPARWHLAGQRTPFQLSRLSTASVRAQSRQCSSPDSASFSRTNSSSPDKKQTQSSHEPQSFATSCDLRKAAALWSNSRIASGNPGAPEVDNGSGESRRRICVGKGCHTVALLLKQR